MGPFKNVWGLKGLSQKCSGEKYRVLLRDVTDFNHVFENDVMHGPVKNVLGKSAESLRGMYPVSADSLRIT